MCRTDEVTPAAFRVEARRKKFRSGTQVNMISMSGDLVYFKHNLARLARLERTSDKLDSMSLVPALNVVKSPRSSSRCSAPNIAVMHCGSQTRNSLPPYCRVKAVAGRLTVTGFPFATTSPIAPNKRLSHGLADCPRCGENLECK